MTESNNQSTFSRIIAGVMNWGEWGVKFTSQEALRFIEQCIEMGVTTFDHADIYGNYTTEALFGTATKGSSSLRQKIQLISKCGIKLVTNNRPDHRIKSYDSSKAHILKSVEQSLKNLRTDYLDLLLIHRPSPLMNPHEIAAAFEGLIQSGKVLKVGVSNFSPSQFDLLNQFVPLSCNQVELSLLHPLPMLDGTLTQCIKKNVIPMAYSALAKGVFFDAVPSEEVQRILFVSNRLQEKYDATFDQILLAWLLQHPSGIHPVMGSTKIERIQSAMQATKVQMNREEWFMLWEAAQGREVA